MNLSNVNADTTYTDVDLNTAESTEVYSANGDATVYGVYMEHSGSTAEVQLEATDGGSTGVLSVPGAGNSLGFGDVFVVGAGESIQVTVGTVEGSALSGTCVVFYSE